MNPHQDICPLCNSEDISEFSSDKNRDYLQCNKCKLVFVPQCYHLAPNQEKAEYDLHDNNPEDLGYRKFLSRIFDPVEKMIKPNSYGLDFGCGPGPTLSIMLEEAGHRMDIFDIFYFKNEAVFDTKYDFVTASEVVEHLSEPLTELQKLWNVLKPNGVLGIMTKRVFDQERFKSWHYKNDKTHISFFCDETFEFIADVLDAEYSFPSADVCILQKK